jgi:hypothetical protein
VPDIHYLALRDIASSSTGVTAAEIYRQANVDNTLRDWSPVRLTAADWVPWDQVGGVFQGKHVCFVVHGFNVNTDHGVKSGGPAAQEYENLGALALAMTSADMVVPVLWPGDGFGFLGPLAPGISWFTAFGHAMTAGQRFADFLLSRAFTAREVSVVSHSLGARVVLEAIAQAAARFSRPDEIRFSDAILMAAAVDDTILDQDRYASAIAALSRIVVLSSKKDSVVGTIFSVGDWGDGLFVEGGLWRGYQGDSRGLGYWGPAFKPGSKARDKTEWYEVLPAVGQGHGDYLPAAQNPATPPWINGWSEKRDRTGQFCQAVSDAQGFPGAFAGKIADRTGSFRTGWKPKI